MIQEAQISKQNIPYTFSQMFLEFPSVTVIMVFFSNSTVQFAEIFSLIETI
jgi:hypothetical protein